MLRRWGAPVLAGLAILALLVGTGLRGLDFGYHWDEGKLVHALDRLHQDGVPLSTFYNYPSLPYWIAFTVYVAAPPAPRLGTADPAFHLHIRTAFLVFSSLVLVWVFAAVIAAGQHCLGGGDGDRNPGALLGTGLSPALDRPRWTAHGFRGGDPLLRPHGPCDNPEKRRWIRSAAVAAGLATGSKYPGGLLILPVLLVLLQEGARRADGRPAALPWRHVPGPGLPEGGGRGC